MEPLAIPGLEVLEEVGRGATSVVYRARRGDRVVAVKLYRGADEAPLFRTEAAALARVRHPGLADILEVGQADGRPYLVMEYVEGPTLTSVLAAEGRLDDAHLVALATTLGSALSELHRHGLVHRDVKPDNILLQPDGGAKLIDFGLAAHATTAADDQAVGTFLYAAPEQTGMLKRPVDSRSDLYSLGALLFECAAGRPPFLATDAGEIIRQHAATPAPDLTTLNPSISPAFARIVARLLAKDPDDRYQTGLGLVADLQVLSILNAALLSGQPAALATRDDPAALVETPLIGRDEEMLRLHRGWSEVVRGRGLVVLLEGEPGSGKSRMVRELLRGIESTTALVLAGKCSEGDPLPLAPLRAALHDWVRRLRRQAPERRADVERQVALAVGDAAHFLPHFAPGLAPLLGSADDAHHRVEGTQERFAEVIAGFLLRLARAHGMGLLFLDDVQWLDHTSRRVLARLVEEIRDAPLLLVCTSRVGDDVAEETQRFLAGLEPGALQRIALTPLDEAAVDRLVTAYLGGRPVAPELVRQIAVRSDGNPFAASEYVRAMLETGLLQPSWGTWRVDTAGLESVNLPSDVIQLIVRRVARLGEKPREVLSAAAVLGSHFQPDTLALVCGGDAQEVLAAITEAARAHLVERVEGDAYVFIHDRVREALLIGVDPQALRRLHQRAAEALEALGSSDPASVYAIARHYTLGEASQHADRVYRTSLAAGLLAAEHYADEEAYSFLDQAHRAALVADLPRDPALIEALSEACARTGRWARAMAHLESALDQEQDPLRRAGLRTRLAQVYLANRETAHAWSEVERAFHEVGETLPSRAVAPVTLARAWAYVTRATPATAPPRAQADRERLEMLARLHIVAAQVAYVENETALVLWLVLRALVHASDLGPSRELASAYTAIAMALGARGRHAEAERYAGLARDLATALGDRGALARGMVGAAWAKHTGGTVREAETLMRRSLEEHGPWLDPQDYVAACTDLAWNLLMRGYCREAWEWIQRAMRRTERSPAQRLSLSTDAAALLAVLGRGRDAANHLRQAHEVVRQTVSGRWAWSDFLALSVLFYLEQDTLGEPLEEAIARHRALDLRPERASFHARHFYVFQAHARLAQAMRAEPADRPAALASLEVAVADLRLAASHPTLAAHLSVVEAGLYRLQRRSADADRLLVQAEALANEQDNVWVRFEVARQRGHLLADRDHHPAAAREARIAVGLAIEQGWVNRARWIRDEFRLGHAPMPILDAAGGAWADPLRHRLQQHLDALLQVSLAAARVLDLREQARVALDEIIRILGAQRAYLFLCEPGSEDLALAAGRDAEGRDLTELTGYSRSVVDTVRLSRQSVVVSGTEAGPVSASQSIVAHGLRSIVAAPLLMKDRLVGVVYLDSRLAGGVFTEDDVLVLTAIANHIAIARETAEAFSRQAALTAENARLLQALREQVEELRQSRKLVTAAEERLRQEIAELLHSRVQSRLVVAWHRLGQCEQLLSKDPEQARVMLGEVRSQLDEIREHDVRQASHMLHPSFIRIGLILAVQTLAQSFESQFQVEIRVDPALVEMENAASGGLSEPLRLAAYRVIEEALGNTSRHANASRVEVGLALRDPATLSVTVRDDGHGFDATQLKPGLGMASIAARVGQVDGSWQVTSSPGRGTTLSVLLPLMAPVAAAPKRTRRALAAERA